MTEQNVSTRSIFLSWERLRLVYNGLLVVFVLAWVASLYGTRPFQHPAFWFFCIEGAVVSNLCFLLGPAAESYAAWLLGRPPRWLRLTMFVAGTLFTAFAAAIFFSFPLMRFMRA